MLRERIARDRPGEGVLGEEEGDDGGPVRWIVDPVDGTRNFSRGVPIWATLIALERDGELACGVVSAPALGHRWWAGRGRGAFRDGERIEVSRVDDLAQAAVAATYARDLAVLEPLAWHARGVGDFWQHMLVAEGALDAAADARLELWDYAPVSIVVAEAGGLLTQLDGSAPVPGAQVLSSNGLLHDAVCGLLRSA